MTSSQQVRRSRAFQGLDAEQGPAKPLSQADTRWLIEQVVERALQPEIKPQPRLRSLRTLSIAALAVVTSAAAATVVHQQLQRNAALGAASVSAPLRQTRKLTPGRDRSAAADEPRMQSAPSAEAPVADSAPMTIRAKIPTAGVPNAGLPAPGVKVVDELSAANDLRRRSQWQAAEAAYRSIAARYPGTQEATVAQLAAGELRLDHLGDAAGALRLYQNVPRSNTLGVEVLFGISRAYRVLGEPAAESAALRSLLDAYPTSLQADGARTRLQQLSAESTVP